MRETLKTIAKAFNCPIVNCEEVDEKSFVCQRVAFFALEAKREGVPHLNGVQVDQVWYEIFIGSDGALRLAPHYKLDTFFRFQSEGEIVNRLELELDTETTHRVKQVVAHLKSKLV